MCLKCQEGRQRNGLGDGKLWDLRNGWGVTQLIDLSQDHLAWDATPSKKMMPWFLVHKVSTGLGLRQWAEKGSSPWTSGSEVCTATPRRRENRRHCSVDGAIALREVLRGQAAGRGAVDAGSLLCLAPGALAQAPPSPFSPGIPETWHRVCGVGFRVSAGAVFPAT